MRATCSCATATRRAAPVHAPIRLSLVPQSPPRNSRTPDVPVPVRDRGTGRPDAAHVSKPLHHTACATILTYDGETPQRISASSLVLVLIQELHFLLQTVMNAMPVLVMTKDRKGIYVEVNDACEHFLRHTRAEVVGKTDFDLFPPELAEAFRADDLRVMNTGQPLQRAEVVPGKAGERVLAISKVPWRNCAGEIIGVISSATDVTRQKQTEENLRDSQTRLAHVIAGTNAGLWEVMVTGHSATAALTDAMDFGASDYLLKPIDFEELATVLSEAWRRLNRWRQSLAQTLASVNAARVS